MNITDVTIRKICHGLKLKAVVSITIDECIAIHEIKVIERSQDNFFLSMPCKKIMGDNGNVSYRDIVHPINNEERQELEDKVLSAYFIAVEESFM